MSTVWGVAYTRYLSDPRVRRESEALAERGDDVTVLCLAEAGRPKRETVRGVTIQRMPMGRYRGAAAGQYILGYGQFVTRACVWMATHRPPDVVHVHTVPDALVFAAVVPRLRGSRVILDVHDLTPDLYALKFGEQSLTVRVLKLIEGFSLRFAHAVVTVHEPYRALLRRRGAAADRLHVVMNVPDDGLFDPTRLRHSVSGQACGTVRFVYHGTLTYRYGVDVLVRAFAQVAPELPDVRLAIYGDGDYRAEAVQLAADLQLNGRVEFSRGFVPVDALLPLLVQADVGVVPNRDNAFTKHILPTKLLEYAALGLPAIVSETEVVRAYFNEDMVRFVRPGDVDDLSRALLDLARDTAGRRRLGQSIQRFSAEHTWASSRASLFRAIDGAPPPAKTPVGAARVQ